MPGFWKNEYLFNIGKVDEQHKRFFSYCDSLNDINKKAVLVKNDIYQMFNLLLHLRSYAFFHFYTEEKYMMEIKFPGLMDHTLEHDKYIIAVTKFKNDFIPLFKSFESGSDNLHEIKIFFIKLLDFVASWYGRHILKVDIKYSNFVNRL